METIKDFNAEKSMIRVAALLHYKLKANSNKTRQIIRKYGGFKNQNSNLRKIEEDFPAFLRFITHKYKVGFTRHKVNREDRLKPYKDEDGNFIEPGNEWSEYAHTADEL